MSAFEQLPGEASATFGARSAVRKDDRVRVTVDLPSDDPNTDIFVAGDGIVTFGMSKLKDRQANSAVFSVRIISGKDKKTPPLQLHAGSGRQGGLRNDRRAGIAIKILDFSKCAPYLRKVAYHHLTGSYS